MEPIERAVGCVAKTKILVSPKEPRVNTVYKVLLPNGNPVPLKCDPKLWLDISLVYEVIADPRNGPFRVTTKAYQYALTTEDGQEVVGYHWHPSGHSHEPRPHIHIGSGQVRPGAVLGNKVHLMTGRCSIEQVIRTAIQMGAQPGNPAWSEVLDHGHDRFVTYRTWH